MKDFCRRVIVAPLFAAAAALLLVGAYHDVLCWFVIAIVAILSALAVWEYGQLARTKGAKMGNTVVVLAFLVSISFVLSPALAASIFALGFALLFALHFKKLDGSLLDLASASFALLYIAVPMGMLLGTLYMPGLDGRWWVAYLLAVTKISDVGGYVMGSVWGNYKLAPRISPKKTVEGALFGLVLSLGMSWLFFKIGVVSSEEWWILGLILGVVGQFGDLAESLLKRDAGKKDSNTLPGLGGMLDSVDSLLLNSVILYMYL